MLCGPVNVRGYCYVKNKGLCLLRDQSHSTQEITVKIRTFLILEDGSIFEGSSFGAEVESVGEVVFTTSMTGYQEVLTDPSFAGQIVVPTYPMIGNYGINEIDFESKQIQVSGFVVREDCQRPSHGLSSSTLDQYLLAHDIPGLSGIDTRSLVRKLRSHGVMMGMITHGESPTDAVERLQSLPRYDTIDFVRRVTTPEAFEWEPGNDLSGPRIALLDSGTKFNILRSLRQLGCSVVALPCTASPDEVMTFKPDGIFFSPGPGDPALLDYLIDTIKDLVVKKPVMGICLGHQLIGRAFGAETFKLKFGHRGANHPVKDIQFGRVYITAQNHGYAIDADTVKGGLEVSHINLNDGTVEGLRHRDLPLFTIQYHSEASPGPLDNMYLFEKFVNVVKENM